MPFVERRCDSSARHGVSSRGVGAGRATLLKCRQFQEMPMITDRQSRLRYALVVFAAVIAAVFVAASSRAAGLDLHADADAADVGLPAYPGATKQSPNGGDTKGFRFGVWGESFGFKLAVVGYRSDDSVDKVAAFYRDALGKYGAVLDCTHHLKKGDGQRRDDDKAAKDAPVSCGDDTVEAGSRLFKVGTERSQRVVKVKPWRDGARFELVHVEEHGTD
jgi:hypothetical protein